MGELYDYFFKTNKLITVDNFLNLAILFPFKKKNLRLKLQPPRSSIADKIIKNLQKAHFYRKKYFIKNK